MLSLTLREMRAHGRRLLGTSFAVLLGVAFLTGTLVLGDTLRRNFDTLFTDVNAGTDVVVRNATDLGHRRRRGAHPRVPRRRGRAGSTASTTAEPVVTGLRPAARRRRRGRRRQRPAAARRQLDHRPRPQPLPPGRGPGPRGQRRGGGQQGGRRRRRPGDRRHDHRAHARTGRGHDRGHRHVRRPGRPGRGHVHRLRPRRRHGPRRQVVRPGDVDLGAGRRLDVAGGAGRPGGRGAALGRRGEHRGRRSARSRPTTSTSCSSTC